MKLSVKEDFTIKERKIHRKRRTWRPYLDVKKVTDVKADGRAVNRRIIIDGSVIAHVGPHGKRYRFRLKDKLNVPIKRLNVLLICLVTIYGDSHRFCIHLNFLFLLLLNIQQCIIPYFA